MIRFRGIHKGKPYGSEQGILNAILLYLATRGITHAHVRNTGKMFRDPRTGALRFGTPAVRQRGVADILACYKGRFLAIEVKSPIGRISTDQLNWLSRCRYNGGISLVARHLNEVIALLDGIDEKTI